MRKSDNNTRARTAGPRWWPLCLLVAVLVAILVVNWSFLGESRQDRVQLTILTSLASAGLAWMWLLFLSRMRWKTRLGVSGAVAALVALSIALVRVEGVSGDLVPLLAWRWQKISYPVSGSDTTAGPGRAADLQHTSPHDYPQFLGPTRDAVVQGIRLARDWESDPPRLSWRRPVGPGWSSFAVVGSSAVTQEQRGPVETVTCYSLETGAELWRHEDRARYANAIAGEGPRATPTVAGGRVFAMGATGILNALDGATGRKVWSRQIVEENGAENPIWGKSCSPLVLDDLVVVSAGGPNGRSLVAYASDTGELVWSGGSDASGYSSPSVAALGGRRQIVILNHASVAGHDPASGGLLWSHPWPDGHPNVSQPLAAGDGRLLVSSGYGVGCELLEIRGGEGGQMRVVSRWKNLNLKAKFTNMVSRDGYVYALDDGILVCLDLATGKRAWKRGRYGHGQVILADDLLLIQAETGDVALVEATPAGHRELTRFTAIEGKTWNHPVLAGGSLLVRNHREAACYELPLATD